MKDSAKKGLPRPLAFSSCIKSDVWHPAKNKNGYEWWYFDALSDDGKEAIVITFFDNYIFSPRYNSLCRKSLKKETETSSIEEHFPVVEFAYYKNGKTIYKCVNEFAPKDFSAQTKTSECTIGDNSFKFEHAPYGSGYIVSINARLGKNKFLTANFEWLSIENDFSQKEFPKSSASHCWNMVVPRSDVTGRINIIKNNGDAISEVNFRGTGYHDHILDNRWMPNTIEFLQQGRVHFPDSTAIFYCYKEMGSNTLTTKLIIIKNGKLQPIEAQCIQKKHQRNLYNMQYPAQLEFESEDNLHLSIKHKETINSSFSNIKYLCEATLSQKNSVPTKATGITEYISPKLLKYRWFDWLSGMRIKRN